MYFFVLEDSGGLICWVHSFVNLYHIYISVMCVIFLILSNRSVLCMVFILVAVMNILVFIGEIHKSSIFFSDLFYILWNPWNPYYLSFSGFLSLVCVQVSSMLASGVRERDHICYVFVFLETNWYCLLHSYYIVHFTGNCWNSPIACLSIDLVSITNLF